MIKNVFRAILFTLGIVLSIVVVVALLYITMWFMIGTIVVLLFLSVYYTLQAKDSL